MQLSQQSVDTIVNDLVNAYTGQIISYYGQFPGESMVPVAYYVEKITGISPIPEMAHNRTDGWAIQFPGQLEPYFNHEAYQTNKQYPRGTILIWSNQHIGILLHSDTTDVVQVFEQNADPVGSPCATKSRVLHTSEYTCIYALTPKIQAELSYIDALTAPGPVYALPQAPLNIPVKKQLIRIHSTIMYFRSHTDAENKTKPVSTVSPGKYYVLKTASNGMLYLAKRRNDTLRFWINPKDNVEEQMLSNRVDEIFHGNQWKETMRWFNPDHSPINYVSLSSLLIIDADRRGESKPLPKNTMVGIYGTFLKDNVEYARLFLIEDTHKIYWHCVQPKYLQEYGQWISDQEEVFDDTTTLEERQTYHTLTWHDHYVHFKAHIRQFFVSLGVLDEINKENKS